MREIGYCQLGVYIPCVGVCRVPLMGRSSKQSNKQTNKQTNETNRQYSNITRKLTWVQLLLTDATNCPRPARLTRTGVLVNPVLAIATILARVALAFVDIL